MGKQGEHVSELDNISTLEGGKKTRLRCRSMGIMKREILRAINKPLLTTVTLKTEYHKWRETKGEKGVRKKEKWMKE